MSIAKRVRAAAGPQQSIGAATPERAARAPDGLQVEALSHNTGHVRARVRAPMQPHAAANNRLAREAAIRDAELHGGKKPKEDDIPEPKYERTRLDIVLDGEDGRILRWALSRYVEDQIAIHRKGGVSDSGKVDGAQDDGGKMPFTEAQRKALARLAFVHSRIGPSAKRHLETFARMMAPIDSRDPPSVVEFAHDATGIVDRRPQEGCFIGLMWAVAERLYEVYRAKDFPERLEISSGE